MITPIYAILATSLAIAKIPVVPVETPLVPERPAEMPPNGFKGKQYVDSKGCVFMRANVDGEVMWVPQVGRDRQPICDHKPTFDATRQSGSVMPSGQLG